MERLVSSGSAIVNDTFESVFSSAYRHLSFITKSLCKLISFPYIHIFVTQFLAPLRNIY
jgi:hypothetical protein